MKYFTIKELCKTSTGLPNVPNREQEANLVFLIENVLDPVRKELGQPIIVTSGFRSEAVNKAVGGVKNSVHKNGQAADIRWNTGATGYKCNATWNDYLIL